jgi:hypothetical protein
MSIKPGTIYPPWQSITLSACTQHSLMLTIVTDGHPIPLAVLERTDLEG